ncbi:MAG TPA: hypothetical protein VJK48_03805 [Chlamydiales bacterium]|nr:hypothetical protein [Chlamydiales bacterium]
MKEILETLKEIIYSLEKGKSPFLLCALFLREEGLGRWDLILSATWLKADELDSYSLINSKLKDCLNDLQRNKISHVVILDSSDRTVQFLLERERLENGGYKEFPQIDCEELTERFGFTIKKAYLLRSQKG